MNMSEKDFRYLEEKLAERPFRYEELYFEMLDHVLSVYENSSYDDAAEFWKKEKTNWTWWKIYKLRFSLHLSEINIFLKSFIHAFFDFQKKEGFIKVAFLFLASFIGFGIYDQEQIMTAIACILLSYPFFRNAFYYHKDGDTIGEKMKLLTKNWYVSVKRDALYSVDLLVIFSIVLLISFFKNSLGVEGNLQVFYDNPYLSTAMIASLLFANRSLERTYHKLLKPNLCR